MICPAVMGRHLRDFTRWARPGSRVEQTYCGFDHLRCAAMIAPTNSPTKDYPMASALFSPITMRGLTMANRTAVSPMCQYNSTDGTANDWHLMHIGNFAMGGWGVVIAE